MKKAALPKKNLSRLPKGKVTGSNVAAFSPYSSRGASVDAWRHAREAALLVGSSQCSSVDIYRMALELDGRGFHLPSDSSVEWCRKEGMISLRKFFLNTPSALGAPLLATPRAA